MRTINDQGSIAPLFVLFVVIVFGGLILGILGLMMATVSNSDNNINTLFTIFWGFISVIVLIVVGFWVLVKAQRSG